jgi:AraC-like DNA-binding protein
MENLYSPFSISYETLDYYPKTSQQQTFFELVYILSGTGTQYINGNSFNYKEGHLFLHTPLDVHSIEIETTTQFFFLRFNDSYIKSNEFKKDNIKHLELILSNSTNQCGCILKNQTDKALFRPLVEAIIRELVNRDLYDQEIINQLVNTIIVIVARNIAKYLPLKVDTRTDDKIQEILHYIQSNIYTPELIKAENISKQFAISDHYLGKYFKKKTEETLQNYIMNYKLQLIESRLKLSNMRINEIANEFNFTDESHLNKFFKKQRGISPKQFKMAQREVELII